MNARSRNPAEFRTRRRVAWGCYALLALATGLLAGLATPALAQPPAAPTGLTAVPDYGAAANITLRWQDNAANETGFEIWRSSTDSVFSVLDSTGVDSTRYVDRAVNRTFEYFYRVRAFNAAGASAFIDTVRQNVKTVWPTPTTHEILHNWNETIGTAAVDETSTITGFHMGVDIQRVGNNVQVVAARGGLVWRTGGANHNRYVIIRYNRGAVLEHISINHLANGVSVAANSIVYAGQPIGQISESYFPRNFTDHVHYFVANAGGFATLPRHPLAIFPGNGERDPGGTDPSLMQHTGSPGTMLYRRDGVGTATYLDQTQLDGNIDIIAEIADHLGTLPDQVPTSVSWWIEEDEEDIEDCITFHDVRSAASPYVLFNWADAYFGDAAGAWGRAVALTDQAQNYGSRLVVGGEQYPWQNYKHFVLTNSGGTNGAAASVIAGWHWNTNGTDDGRSPTGTNANFWGVADTQDPREARFPDGDYKVHVLASDLIHSNIEIVVHDIHLENFCPVVCKCFPEETLPCGTRSVEGSIHFSEEMDTGVTAGDVFDVDNGATISSVQWSGDKMKLEFVLSDLRDGETYTITVTDEARDDVGHKALDGDENGTCGGDYECVFSVAPCANNNNNANNNNGNANNDNGNGNNNNGNANNGNGNANNGNGNGNNNNGNGNNNNGGTPTLIMLLNFNATYATAEGGIEIEWQTGAERRTAGFYVKRSVRGEARREPLNRSLIGARGSDTHGADYSYVDRTAEPNVDYYYWLEEVELNGARRLYGPVPATWVLRFALRPLYPNPARRQAEIRFEVPVEERVVVSIYDISGRLVRQLYDERAAVGVHAVEWDGHDLRGGEVASGIYFARMTAGTFHASKKFVLLK